jgi:hypothetical protein
VSILVAVVCTLAFAQGAWAQDAAPATPAAGGGQEAAPASPDASVLTFFQKAELSGFADTYYTYNFNNPPTGSSTPLRDFDMEHNQFSLALMELALGKPAALDSPVGFRVDLDYGPVAKYVQGADPEGADVMQNIEQAYVSYMAPAGTGLSIDVGKFVTPIGAEVIESKDNWNYSRSFLFSWAIPFYHVGARVGYAVNDKVSLLGWVANGWNNTKDNNSRKSYGAEVGLKPTGAFSLVANYMGGPEQNDDPTDWRHVFDTTATYVITPTISAMANYDYGRDTVAGTKVQWQGAAVYLKGQITPAFAVIPRYEYYSDKDGFTTGTAQTLQELTLTGELKHAGGLLTRIEYRHDFSSVDFFMKDATPRSYQDTLTVGVVVAFSTK